MEWEQERESLRGPAEGAWQPPNTRCPRGLTRSDLCFDCSVIQRAENLSLMLQVGKDKTKGAGSETGTERLE